MEEGRTRLSSIVAENNMRIKRRKTRMIKLGSVAIGSDAPVSIQSMTKTDTRDIDATVAQIKGLEKAGCEVIRIAIKDEDAAKALGAIHKKISIPIEVDIHFNYKLAILAIEQGVEGVRLNPGNVYKKDEVSAVVEMAKKHKVPIRVGLNSGSVRRDSENHPPSTIHHPPSSIAQMMVDAALEYLKILEGLKFYDTMVSLKASDVLSTVEAYRLLAPKCDYPFHVGVTASGLPKVGAIKSAIGIGSLLLDGIGDTIRVSLTGDPVEEIVVGREILQSLGLRQFAPEVISCPTCGRCEIDVEGLAEKVEVEVSKLTTHNSQLTTKKIAVMGCVVNGPGEALDADFAIAGGKGSGIIYKNGKMIKKVNEKDFVKAIVDEIKKSLT